MRFPLSRTAPPSFFHYSLAYLPLRIGSCDHEFHRWQDRRFKKVQSMIEDNGEYGEGEEKNEGVPVLPSKVASGRTECLLRRKVPFFISMMSSISLHRINFSFLVSAGSISVKSCFAILSLRYGLFRIFRRRGKSFKFLSNTLNWIFLKTANLCAG